jgi:hypothetical protein
MHISEIINNLEIMEKPPLPLVLKQKQKAKVKGSLRVMSQLPINSNLNLSILVFLYNYLKFKGKFCNSRNNSEAKLRIYDSFSRVSIKSRSPSPSNYLSFNKNNAASISLIQKIKTSLNNSSIHSFFLLIYF